MSQTLTSLLAHLVFSTKNRMPIITPEIEPELFAYMGGILKAYESRLLDAGGTSDHVHLLVSQSKNIALAKLLKELKQGSSLWIKTVDRQQKFSVAGRLRSFFNWPARRAGVEALSRKPEGASPETNVSGRVTEVSRRIWD